MIEYTTARTKSDLYQILELQKANLKINLQEKEYQNEGYVTIVHDIDVIENLNSPHSHIVAKDGNKVIGYALIAVPSKVPLVPLLRSTIEQLENAKCKNKSVLDSRFFIMCQICIEQEYRGQGIFSKLYQELIIRMKPYFDIIITEISTSNTRSIRAHEKVGFETIKIHKGNDDTWALVGLSINA